MRRFAKFAYFYRSFSTLNNLNAVQVRLTSLQNTTHQCLKFEFDNPSKSLEIPLVWLLDHSRDPQSYNWKTNQKRSNSTELFKSAVLKSFDFDIDEQKLKILWKNGIESHFRIKDLLNWAIRKEPTIPSYTLWDRSTLKQLPSISNKNLDFLEFSKIYLKYGFITVTDVDAHDEIPTKQLCEKIARIQDTFFGHFWVFGVKEGVDEKICVHEDTAYGSEWIGPHNDGTYKEGKRYETKEQKLGAMSEFYERQWSCMSLGVFHCLLPAKIGGDTILVDGFYAAEQLRQKFPEYFEILTTTPIEYHYLEGMTDVDNHKGFENAPIKLYSRSIDPVIKCFNGRVVQIKFNPYDRAPLRNFSFTHTHEPKDPALDTIKFYKAYEKFSQICHAPEAAVEIFLKPGTVIFIDNYRVMHARTAFKGNRKMCGCYLSRDNFLAKVRPLLQIEEI